MKSIQKWIRKLLYSLLGEGSPAPDSGAEKKLYIVIGTRHFVDDHSLWVSVVRSDSKDKVELYARRHAGSGWQHRNWYVFELEKELKDVTEL